MRIIHLDKKSKDVVLDLLIGAIDGTNEIVVCSLMNAITKAIDKK